MKTACFSLQKQSGLIVGPEVILYSLLATVIAVSLFHAFYVMLTESGWFAASMVPLEVAALLEAHRVDLVGAANQNGKCSFPSGNPFLLYIKGSSPPDSNTPYILVTGNCASGSGIGGTVNPFVQDITGTFNQSQ